MNMNGGVIPQLLPESEDNRKSSGNDNMGHKTQASSGGNNNKTDQEFPSKHIGHRGININYQ